MTQPKHLSSRKIAEHTRLLATEQDEFDNLHIRDETDNDGENVMVSEWKPTKEELEILNSGGSFYLGIKGLIHPPVYVAVAEASVEEDEDEPVCG